MARTGVSASASTATFVRMLTIKNQFKIAFQRIMDYSEESYTPYLSAISEKKIDSIAFWAYRKDSHGEREKWCQLTIYVDWDKHENFLLSGEKTVVLKKNWNGIIPEMGAAIDILVELIDEYKLTPTFSVGFVPEISTNDYDLYMKKLGLVSGKPVKWKDDVDVSDMVSVLDVTLSELQEVRAELLISENM